MPPSSRVPLSPPPPWPSGTQQCYLAGLTPSGMPWAKVGPQLWHSVFLPFLRPCLGFSLSTRCYRICRGKAAPTQLTQEPGPCQPLLELCSGPLPGVCWTSFSTFTSATDRKPLLSIYCVQGRVSPGFLCLGIPQEISPNKVGTAGLAR